MLTPVFNYLLNLPFGKLIATKLPKLELYNIANNLKNLLSQDFINDLKIQIEYLNVA